jgi:uncharacterized phage-associated protein
MGAKYRAKDIANYFIWKAAAEGGERISNLKLQKLIYYAQGLHIILYGKPLFQDEIRGWSYGPVVPELYSLYKKYGSGGIPPDRDFDANSIDEHTRGFLDEINVVFGQFSALRLLEISHSDQCWIDALPNKVITHKAMRATLVKYVRDGKKP